MREIDLRITTSGAMRLNRWALLKVIPSAVLLVVFVANAQRAAGQSYTTIDFPGTVGNTVAYGVNNMGQIVGTYGDSSPIPHGFRLVAGQFTSMDFPGANPGASGGAHGINNVGQVGQIVGIYEGAVGTDGYVWTSGSFTPFDIPGASHSFNGGTVPFGINDSGQIVGEFEGNTSSGFGIHGFSAPSSGGSYIPLDFPNSHSTQANGINNAGQIVGQYQPSSGPLAAFLYSNGTFSTISGFQSANGINNTGQIVGFDGVSSGLLLTGNTLTPINYPLAVSTVALGINDAGVIVGYYRDAQGGIHGFVRNPIVLLDPVPTLLSGPAVITPSAQVGSQTGAQLLATKGSPVLGAATDGVSQVVIRIPATNVGDQFSLTLFNDQQPPTQSGLPTEDGALGIPGQQTFTQSQLTVTAINTGNGPNGPNPPYAFAIYRAPVDFARPTSTGFKSGMCNGSSYFDDQSPCRSVSVQVQAISAGGPPISVPIVLVRPPVILIHGLWGDISNWDNFNPLITGPLSADRRFSVGRINYKNIIGPQIIATNPAYQSVASAAENSLGFQYNASRTNTSISQWIKAFKSGTQGVNPLNIAVASVQADIVGHSMGGDISRTLPLLAQYYSGPSFGQGLIHKLITIDTPHLGSPLADNLHLLDPRNACTRGILAGKGNYSFLNVQMQGLGVINGAVGDLSPSSPALNQINNPPQPQPRYIPTALIAGIYTNFASLNCTVCDAFVLRNSSTFGCPNDPLAQSLTPQGWPAIFGTAPNNQNDAIVSLSSQLNTSNPTGMGFQFPGYVHSKGTEGLSFTRPSVLDPDVVPPSTISVPTRVINILNTPVTNSTVFVSLNP